VLVHPEGIVFILWVVELSRLLLQQGVLYLDKAEYVKCRWLLEHTIKTYKYQICTAFWVHLDPFKIE
jgi:hypothetical protein